jgi:hypothetical protein
VKQQVAATPARYNQQKDIYIMTIIRAIAVEGGKLLRL